jgi:predicted GNAT family acetyltransferase
MSNQRGQEPIVVDHLEREDGGELVVAQSGVRLAVMAYRRVDARTIEIELTAIHQALRGMDVARQLFAYAIDWARATGTKVQASCPYARAQLADPAYKDVVDGA